MIWPWFVVTTCLCSEAFFAMAELSITSANPIELERAARDGSRAAALVAWFREKPERLFATTLLGTNLSTVTGSTVASLSLLFYFPDSGEWLAMALMSPLILMGGEIIPKTLAQQHATTMAIRIAGALRIFYYLLQPAIQLTNGFTGALNRVLGFDGRVRTVASREDLVLLMKEDTTQGEVNPGEREMISRIFKFSHLAARDSMIPLVEVCGVPADITVRDAAAMIAREGHSRLPVYRDRIDDIVGVLHHIDLLRAHDGDQPVSERMKPPHFVPETQEIDDILVILQRKAASLAIVVDEFGGAVGILTLEDILEEIVGEIDDEFDSGARLWRTTQDGGYLVSGRAPVEQLNDELKLELPEGGDYETVAGFVLDRLKRIPRVGEMLETQNGARITIVRASKRAIEEVKVVRAPEAHPPPAPQRPES